MGIGLGKMWNALNYQIYEILAVVWWRQSTSIHLKTVKLSTGTISELSSKTAYSEILLIVRIRYQADLILSLKLMNFLQKRETISSYLQRLPVNLACMISRSSIGRKESNKEKIERKGRKNSKNKSKDWAVWMQTEIKISSAIVTLNQRLCLLMINP